MADVLPHQLQLLKCILLEMREQEERYRLDPQSGIKQMKAIGVVLHPISIVRKSFGYADYPEIEFRLPFSTDISAFRDNSAIECFIEGEDPVKGVLLGIEGQKGGFRLFAPDFPDWIEDKGVGIKLAPDHRTSEIMRQNIEQLSSKVEIFDLFKRIHGLSSFGEKIDEKESSEFFNGLLNPSQQRAAKAIANNESLVVLHGPPGTGKTTTLIEGIRQQIAKGKRILVTASSNAAVDNIAKGLINYKVKILRVGNNLKVDEAIAPYTPEGKMLDAKEQKDIRKLKLRAEEFRRMSFQYKRKFGKEEREQRSLLIKEVQSIRREIRQIRDYYNEKLYEQADVILGTPIGLSDFLPKDALFDSLVMDEAGQAIEPLAWVVFPYANSWVLAGDPFQLPPTVLSQKAIEEGYATSIIEHCFKNCSAVYFLDTQYRMRKSIADFSSAYFYKGELQTPEEQNAISQHIIFYDTAGTGFDEQAGAEGASLMNEGELSLAGKIIEKHGIEVAKAAFISPYSGQVQMAKTILPKGLRLSTIDSFQGQEQEVIILSLVRSNPDAVIGFLKDYRRMNVAMTRAKEQLIVIGDSSTIGQDTFYSEFLQYIEKIYGYRSAWELMD